MSDQEEPQLRERNSDTKADIKQFQRFDGQSFQAGKFGGHRREPEGHKDKFDKTLRKC